MKTNPKSFTIEQLFRRSANIDLDPFFQREKVWSPSDQQYFIDTILKGWGTPKIYLAIEKDKQGEENFICIDGKQRLSTIFSFMRKGGFRLKSNQEFKNKIYSELPKLVQDKFNRYKLTVEKVVDYKDQELSELFKRLQHGKSLNSAEKLRGSNTKITKFINSLIRSDFFTNRTSLTKKRFAHFAVAVQLCLLETTGNIVNIKYKDLEKFLKNYFNFNSKSFEAKRIRYILNFLSRMFKSNATELSSRSNIVSIFLLISELMKHGDIKGKEKELYNFFKQFNKDLKNAIAQKMKTKDLNLLIYNNASVQSPDSATSIKDRHQVLLKKLVNYSQFFKKILNLPTDEERFKKLYDKLEKKHANTPTEFNNWLISKNPKIKTIQCKKGVETIPVHVRHSMHHSDHPRYKKSELIDALEILEAIK